MELFAPKQRIAVLSGGLQNTNRVSMAYGGVVQDVLAAHHGFTPLLVSISPSGEWLYEGRVVQPAHFLSHIDGAYVTVVGTYGEDGQLARTLDSHGVPHQTSQPFAALQSWQKQLASERVRQAGIHTPRNVVIQADSNVDLHTLSNRIEDMFTSPYVVKPATGAQRESVHLVTATTDLPAVIAQVLSVYPACVVEEYINGQAVTVASVPNLRSRSLYHTPVMQWRHRFDIDGILTDTEQLALAQLSRQQKQSVAEIAEAVYRTLELSGSVRSDFQVTSDGTVYFIEANSIAPLVSGSALEQTLASVGVSPEEFILSQVAQLRT